MLVEPDRVEAEPFERGLARLTEVLRSTVRAPVGAITRMAALGRDQDVVSGAGIGRQRLRDELLVRTGSALGPGVRIRGVDQRHTDVQRLVNGCYGLLFGRSCVHRERHGAQTDGADVEITESPSSQCLHRSFIPWRSEGRLVHQDGCMDLTVMSEYAVERGRLSVAARFRRLQSKAWMVAQCSLAAGLAWVIAAELFDHP